jgi:outer membrane protein insertion porin family
VNDFFGSVLRGAVFMDAGNIWRLNAQPGDPNVEFRLNNILPATAIDFGTGLRFDLGFFVFRLDAAFKFKDPQFTGSDQWVLIDHFDELFYKPPTKPTIAAIPTTLCSLTSGWDCHFKWISNIECSISDFLRLVLF